jgi:hypothetical protein
MPDLVTCPSCGCRVQVPQTQLGRRTRCIACDGSFYAEAGPVALGDADHYPLVPSEDELVPPRPPAPQRGRPRHQTPLCPGCHRPVGWEAPACPHCGHLFAEAGYASPDFRKDGESHRGELIDRLGGVSLMFGCLTVGLGPLGLLVALATGLPGLTMASRDLERMNTGLVDPAGRTLTEWGRSKAVVGITLGVVLGLFWGLVLFNWLW